MKCNLQYEQYSQKAGETLHNSFNLFPLTHQPEHEIVKNFLKSKKYRHLGLLFEDRSCTK